MRRRKSKPVGKAVFFIIFAFIIALTCTTIFGVNNYYADREDIYIKGVSDIRWGIDIQGGVEAIFVPDIKDANITSTNMEAAKQIIEKRLVNEGINDYEVFVDEAQHQVIVRFPWKSGEKDFDPAATVKELGSTGLLTFSTNESGEQTFDKSKVFLTGKNVVSAQPQVDTETQKWCVALKLDSQGASAFATATKNNIGKYISIFMDGGEDNEIHISTAKVNVAITDGNAVITGNFTYDEAEELANGINAGALPFSLIVDDSKLQIISPTLGNEALLVMVVAGIAAYILVIVMIIAKYRVPGVIAAIALLGQIIATLAVVSGFFPSANGITMTIPGIAGIILSIGMGVDANVIAAERIKEEFSNGKTIDGAIDAGFKNSLSAVLDGNMTVLIVACVLMGAFGSPDNFVTKIFSAIMPFGASVTGIIYSFGYTLFLGVIFTMLFGVLFSKLMIKSLSRIKLFRNPWLYGGAKNVQK